MGSLTSLVMTEIMTFAVIIIFYLLFQPVAFWGDLLTQTGDGVFIEEYILQRLQLILMVLVIGGIIWGLFVKD